MPIQIPVTQTGFEASIQAAAQKAGRNLKIDLGSNARSINALSQPLGRITGQADEFTKSMEAANARVLAFGASVGVLNSVIQGFKSLVTTTIEVEKSLADINSVLQGSGAQLNKFKKDIFDVARETGNSFKTVSEAALELSRQGLPANEVVTRLKDSMILARLSGLDAAQSVEGLTAAVNSFSKEGLTSSQVLNKISNAAAKYAVSERDLIEGFKRSASVAQQAGVSIDELGGIITAVQQKSARGGAVIGNSFKTIFTRIQRPESLKLLEEIGVKVLDLKGNVVPATKLLEGLASKISGLNDVEVASITEKIGGGFQIAPLLSALDDYSSKTSVARAATEAFMSATNQAYERNTALNQTMAAAINEASVNLKEFANTLGEIGVTKGLSNVLSFFNTFISDVQGLLEGEGLGSKFARSIVEGIGNVLSGPGLAIFGGIILKLTTDLVKFGTQSLKTFFNIGSAAKEINTLQGSIASTLLRNKDIQAQILALEGNRAAQARFFTTALNEQYSTMQKMQNIAASIAPAVYGGTVSTKKSSGKNAAGGYMPAISQESRDISRGVGGARGGDRPVVIPNFAFGGGKKGTMVAHTGEYIVPNFARGGSAIFNRDMVRSMGLPAGAKKIGAAGGFIPNFAVAEDQINAKIAQWRMSDNTGLSALKRVLNAKNPDPINKAAAERLLAEKEKAKTPLNQLIPINQNGREFGMIVGERGVSDTLTRFADNTGKTPTPTQTENSKYRIEVPVYRIQDEKLKFTEIPKLTENISKLATRAALKMAKGLSGNKMPKPENAAYIEKTLNPGALGGTAGTIFEAGIAGILNSNDFKDYEKTPRNSLIDFRGNFSDIRKLYNIPNGLAEIGVEAKGSSGSDLVSSAAEKFLKVTMGEDPFSGQKRKKAATGFIPNFAKYIYDSDRITPDKGATLKAVLASQVKKNLIIGPAGSGKSTLAGKMGKFLSGVGDVANASEIDILSGAARAKGGGISKNLEAIISAVNGSGGKVSYLYAKNLDILSRRAGRTVAEEGDLRSKKQLKGTTYAPLNQFDFMGYVKSKSRNFNLVNGAKGFIPNFADPLKEAIGREMSAGVPASQIYVDQNSSLKNAMNPMGLMVANRRDEPAGGMQGISRARKEGANPMLYGAAGGFVPNYVNLSSAVSTSTGIGIQKGGGVDQALKEFSKNVMQAGADMNKLSAELKNKIQSLVNDKAVTQQLTEAAKQEIFNRKSLISTKQSSIAQSILENQSNKKLTAQLDKVYIEYNKSQKSAADLDAAQKKAAAILQKTSLSQSSQRAIVSSTAGLAESRSSASPESKGSRDLLGTIFAVQAGLSLLTGATNDSTSALVRYTNVISNSLGNITTAAFAASAFKDMATTGKGLVGVFGKLGVAGAAVGAAFALFEGGKQLYYEYSGANKRASDAANILASSAEKAAVRLENLNPESKESINKTVEDIIKKLNIQVSEPELPKLKEAITTGLLGTSRTNVEDILGKNLTRSKLEKKEIDTSEPSPTDALRAASSPGIMVPNVKYKYTTEEALTGDPLKAIAALAEQGVSGQGATLMGPFLSLVKEAKNAEELSSFLANPKLNEKINENLKNIDTKSLFDLTDINKTFEQVSILNNSKDFAGTFEAMEGKTSLVSSLKEQEASIAIIYEFVKLIQAAREETEKNATIETVKQEQALSKVLQDSLKKSALERPTKTMQQAGSLLESSLEISNKQKLLQITGDLSISEDLRKQRLEEVNHQYEISKIGLQNQVKLAKELGSSLEKISSGDILGFGSNSEQATKQAKAFIEKFTSDSNNQNALEGLLAGNKNQDFINQLRSQVQTGANLFDTPGKQDELIRIIKEYYELTQDITLEEKTQINNKQKLFEVSQKELSIEKQRQNLIEKGNLYIKTAQSRLTGRIEDISNESQLNEARKNLEIKRFEKTGKTVDPRENERIIESINEKYFKLQQDLNDQKAEAEIKLEITRGLKIDDNITSLGANTTAIGSVQDALINNILPVLNTLPKNMAEQLKNAVLGLNNGGQAVPQTTQAGYSAGNINNSGLSQGLMDFVKKREGFEARAYSDYGQMSIGYGTKAKIGELGTISEEEASNRLAEELKSHVDRIENAAKEYGITLNQNQKDALTSFDYNTGKGVNLLSRFKGEFESSFEVLGSKMLEYNKAGEEFSFGLAERRKKEVAIFNAPVTTANNTPVTTANSRYGAINPEGTGGQYRIHPLSSSEQGRKLFNLMEEVSRSMELQYKITSALQEAGKGTGSTRHNKEVGSADIKLIKNGQTVNFTTAEGEKIAAEFVKRLVSQGVTGVGAGKTAANYMGPETMHVGYGNPAIWGGTKKNPGPVPDWLRSSFTQGRREAGYTTSGISASALANQTLSQTNPIYQAGERISGISDSTARTESALEEAKKLVDRTGKSDEEIKKKINEIANQIIAASDAIISKGKTKTTADALNQLSKQNTKLEAQPGTFASGFTTGMENINKEIAGFSEQIGERIPALFADNMAKAMEDAILNGEDLGDSLRSAATSFLSEINKANFKNLANIFTSGLQQAGSSIFSSFTQRASGGPITGGSGTKDDVPALLMGGEFVMNKKSVSKYGMNFMNQLNNGNLPKFAKGGSVEESVSNLEEIGKHRILTGKTGSNIAGEYSTSKIPKQSATQGSFYSPGMYGSGAIKGKSDLLSFATQSTTSGANDIIMNQNKLSYVSLEPESGRLTVKGRTESPEAAAIQKDKGEAFSLYLQQLGQEEQAEKDYKAQKKAFKKQLVNALISTVATAGIKAIAGPALSGFQAGMGQAASQGLTGFQALGSGFQGIWSGGNFAGTQIGGLSNFFSGNNQLANIGTVSQLSSLYQSNPNSNLGKLLASNASNYISNITVPKAIPVNRATGGLIPNTSGTDTVPAMLSGGEFVMNRAATQNIGVGALQSLNTGNTLEGGSTESTDKIVSKLDELITAIKENMTGNVSVNVSSDGQSNKENTGGTGDSSSESQKNAALTKKIREAVVQVIQQEKRLGGTLRMAK
jgi:TP901 family phage tail tape measure protein